MPKIVQKIKKKCIGCGIDNGETLCKQCHKKTPNYGGKVIIRINK